MKKQHNILVVDDEKPLRITTSNLVESIGGCTVQTAEDGMEAMQCLRSWEFDLVITDNNMPGMEGVELLERMRAEERFKHIPVILQSGDGYPGLETRVKELGGRFLTKPSEKFIETVEELLASRK
ncbi:response regulator [Candidatus Kaiserbacteria bacterium]|nr:response regulator [Candidatus Kaiserbacteria bacterium]